MCPLQHVSRAPPGVASRSPQSVAAIVKALLPLTTCLPFYAGLDAGELVQVRYRIYSRQDLLTLGSSHARISIRLAVPNDLGGAPSFWRL